MRKQRKQYPLNQCALYGISTRKKLATRLDRSLPFLISRANNPSAYRVWKEPKKSGGSRLIEAPRSDLKAIQRRIAELLQRVRPPDFLFSPVKGRSYVDNALVHKHSESIHLLDISDYFGNCLAKSVYHFFHQEMRCAPDVAYLLTGLTTRKGHLPQGSPASPILSFYSCKHMWEEIASLVHAHHCKMSLYVDDLTISGKVVPKALIFKVKGILHANGHNFSEHKEDSKHRHRAEVTGLMVGIGKASVPHRHYLKLLYARNEARNGGSEVEKQRAASRAVSLAHQISEVQKR